MYAKTAIVCNETGIHARPASDFVRVANRFGASITIKELPDGDAANAKSIIEVLTLGIAEGCEVEVCADGTDEVSAVDTLIEMIESGFTKTGAEQEG